MNALRHISLIAALAGCVCIGWEAREFLAIDERAELRKAARSEPLLPERILGDQLGRVYITLAFTCGKQRQGQQMLDASYQRLGLGKPEPMPYSEDCARMESIAMSEVKKP